MAPRKANTGTYKGDRVAKPQAIASTAPQAAPSLVPRISGEASGCLNSPCICTPASASPAPTSAATSTRGVRINHTTTISASLILCTSIQPWGKSLAASTLATTTGAIEVLPTLRPARSDSANTASSTINTPVVVLRRWCAAAMVDLGSMVVLLTFMMARHTARGQAVRYLALCGVSRSRTDDLG